MTVRVVCGIYLSLLAVAPDAAAFDVVDRAASYIGRPYVWGAEGPNAFDCSGLTQHVFREARIELPRRAVSQSQVGEAVGSRLQRGDLVFFRSGPSHPWTVTHVGIYEGGGMMINASKRHGRVLRESLHSAYWTERFMFARRITAGADSRGEERVAQRRGNDRIARRLPPDLERGTTRVVTTVAEELLRRAMRRRLRF